MLMSLVKALELDEEISETLDLERWFIFAPNVNFLKDVDGLEED